MASSIVKSVAQQLGNLVVEEAKYLYSVRDKIESLQTELEWAECFLRDADTQQHQDRIVCKWVSQVRDFAYDGQDLIEMYLHGISHRNRRQDGIRNTLKWFSCILWTCDAWTLHNLGSEIDNLTLKMSELTSRLQRYGIKILQPTRSLEYNNMIREERRTYSHTEEDPIGLEKDIRQVVDQLLDIQIKVVAISGTGGLGKTTLARKVFKHKDIKGHFNDNCAWVYISREFDNKTIFQEILRQLERGNDNANKMTEQLAEEIHKLLQGKKCLVVVDDIWTVQAWERLKPAFDSIFKTASSSSSKILLTTRTKDLVQHVDPKSGYLHPLEPLSEDDSWKLLKRKAFIGGVHGSSGLVRDDDHSGYNSHRLQPPSDEIDDGGKLIPIGPETESADDGVKEKLGKDMLKHCGGLPIAIITLGGILSTKKTPSEWEDVQRNISSYLMGSKEAEITNNNHLLEILELSYNELPYFLKPCFLYLGNFPEDYEISSHRLYHLWEAECFFVVEDEVKKKGGTSYDIGEKYLNGLVQRSMVLVRKCWPSGRIKTCQVHDVIRDLCLRKCEEVGFLSHIECKESGMVHGVPPFSTEIKKLRRCALMGEDEVDEKWQFREKAIGLRSLLVFNERFTPGREIWKSCPLLRVLDLEGTYYRPYGMKCLIHLRYLSLRGLKLEEIPSCLSDLQYVETLDLRERYNSIQSFQNSMFYKMKRLRHLYLPRYFIVEGSKKLKFPIEAQMETIKNFNPKSCEIEDLMQMTNLRVFSITTVYTFKKAKELKRVLEAPVIKKAEQLINNFRLQIDEDVIIEDPAIFSPVAGHPSFKGLTIVGPGEQVKKKGNTIIFPKSLTWVVLYDCAAIGDVLLGIKMFPCLKSLSIYRGQVDNKLLSFSDGSFPQLTQLILRDQMELEEWEVGKGALPNLQSLMLVGWEKLKKVVINELPDSLTQVEIINCEFGEGGASLIGWLEKLPRLQVLTIYRVGGGNKLSFSNDSFPQLTKLRIQRTEWEEWEVGKGAIANLQSLELSGWKKLKKVVMNEFPDSLTQVEVKLRDFEVGEGGVSLLGWLEKLPRLQELTIYGGGGGNKLISFSNDSFPQLTKLQIENTQWEEWEVGKGALANLQILKFWGLKKVVMNELLDCLTGVEILNCGEGGVSLLDGLEKLPRLQTLEIGLVGSNKLSFSPGSFPQLAELGLTWNPELLEFEVGDGALPNLQRLKLQSCKKLNLLSNLPNSLTLVYLWNCEIGERVGGVLLLALENLPCLQQLVISHLIGNKMRFSPGSFPQLRQLEMFYAEELEEWEVGDGALPTLQRLRLESCYKLKKLPEGLPDSVHIECRNPCIKGIEKYNTCPHLKKSRRRLKPMRWLHDSCA